MDRATIICRCEEVTLGDIEDALAAGLILPGDVRKYTRAGMGSCQGRTCQRLVMQAIKRYLQQDPGVYEETALVRTPIQPVSVDELASWE